MPAVRSDSDILRTLAIGIGLCWAVLFIVIGLGYELQIYADGSLFSYAVAAQDAWAFHWHNISGRLSVFLLTLWPAEIYVGLTGSPAGGIVVYGLLFYIAPLVGLIGTFFADRSRGRTFFTYACGSTALLCPLVFGFPTEMWLAHALFWPALTVAHTARRGIAGRVLVFVLLLALILSHEGALVLAFSIVATLVPRGLRDDAFLRAVGALIAALIAWATVKIVFPPGHYFEGVLVRAALDFFDWAIFRAPFVRLLLATIAGYGIVLLVLARRAPGKAHLYAAALVAMALTAYWLFLDHALHASNRYYLRTAFVVVAPVLGALAALYTLRADGLLTLPVPYLAQTMTALASGAAARALAGVLLLVTLVYTVETAKFVTAWTKYKAAVAALATGANSDPALGDPRFVSSARINADLNRLSWFSTTQYLSVIVANFAPTRLVIDPNDNYFWLTCATATANFKAARAIPAATRDLVRIDACLHR